MAVDEVAGCSTKAPIFVVKKKKKVEKHMRTKFATDL